MADSLFAPAARARFVVTLPPEPSRVGEKLRYRAGAAFASMTDTKDAFAHLALRSVDRFVIMTPFVDATGAAWAADLFEQSGARRKVLVLRDKSQLVNGNPSVARMHDAGVLFFDYQLLERPDQSPNEAETFHAKIVLADGVAAYVGSANLLYRSRERNLECGFLLEGDAVRQVSMLVDAVLALFE